MKPILPERVCETRTVSSVLSALVSPEIVYSWVFNEFPSFVAEDSRRFISQHTGNLYISKVQPSDVGSYICLVKNAVTNARVLSPPTPLTLKTDGEAARASAVARVQIRIFFKKRIFVEDPEIYRQTVYYMGEITLASRA